MYPVAYSSFSYSQPLVVGGYSDSVRFDTPEEDFDYVDHIVGSYRPSFAPLTTTMRYRPMTLSPSTTPTTVKESSISEDDNANDEITNLLVQLPWMKPFIGQPDLLTVDGRTYHIGNNHTVVEEKPCEVVTLGKSGSCTLIFNCPSVHSELTDVEAYKSYFCGLETDKYAGVCCVE